MHTQVFKHTCIFNKLYTKKEKCSFYDPHNILNFLNIFLIIQSEFNPKPIQPILVNILMSLMYFLCLWNIYFFQKREKEDNILSMK